MGDRVGRWVIEDEPSRRFPVYTRGNSGEVYPNVMTPLTGSLIGDAATAGQINAMRRLGMLVDADLTEPGAVGTGVFGGYLYGNLSLMRVICERAPGMSALDADRQIAGVTADAPPYRRQPGDRNLIASVRGTSVMSKNLLWPNIDEVDAAQSATERWRAGLAAPTSLSDSELIEVVKKFPARFADGMGLLLYYSSFAAGSSAMMEQFAERAGAPPGTAASLTAGLGTIDSASPAFLLWRLGRLVGESATLTRIFDDGDDLAAHHDHPDVAGFHDSLESFIQRHGARGPDEWELASPTWGTDPEIVLAAVERLRRAPDSRDPVAAGERLRVERERAVEMVRRALPRPARRIFARLARGARLYPEGRERAKAVFIDGAYPTRCALFELAARARERGGPEDRRDFFLVTIDELADYIADPTSFESTVDERRRQRDFLQQRVPPFLFERELPDPRTWPLRSPAGGATVAKAEAATTLQGLGVCPGIARGTVRVILDPAEPGALEPDDILVAPITDPAWTPLFLAVCGVVVDVGAQQSHAAIVARELGIPAVVGVTDATGRLRDGQRIEVNGATGIVTVL